MARVPHCRGRDPFSPLTQGNTMNMLNFSGGFVLSLLLACSAGPEPVANSPHDPSSPAAAEAATPSHLAGAEEGAPPAGNAESAGSEHPAPATEPHAGHGSHGSAATQGSAEVAYTCPMHPEVVSKTPGVCPKCNMNLVPKK